MMLTAHVPQQYTETIECSQIRKFTNKIDATAYQQSNGGMVIKEHGKDIYYVMPEFNGILTGGCLEAE